MAVTGSLETDRANRARHKLENDYRSSVVYFVGGLVVLAAWAVLLVTGFLRGSLAGLQTVLLGVGILIAAVGGSLIVVNGWLLKRRSPRSPLPRMR